jgi:hypothetical protein
MADLALSTIVLVEQIETSFVCPGSSYLLHGGTKQFWAGVQQITVSNRCRPLSSLLFSWRFQIEPAIS